MSDPVDQCNIVISNDAHVCARNGGRQEVADLADGCYRAVRDSKNPPPALIIIAAAGQLTTAHDRP